MNRTLPSTSASMKASSLSLNGGGASTDEAPVESLNRGKFEEDQAMPREPLSGGTARASHRFGPGVPSIW